MRTSLLVLALFAAPALADEPKPRPDLTCQKASDCAVTHYTADCCVVCAWTPGAKTSVAALTAYCQAHPNPKCPPFDCPPMDPAVQCAKGVCRLKSQ